ncbi:glutamate receptor-like [Scylla paramamosain]|uniref:glutamate receptor-like n=1 Tax=Scylla paramamosain TaxID=85552 RepID=UPI0030833328
MPYFPYINYKYVQSANGPIVLYLEDSLNTHMLNTLARHMNFTYELRHASDGKFGTPAEGGNWTGVVGTLQHEMADFSMDLTVTPQRAEVVEYSRAYIDESLVILSSKPKPLPEYLSVVRPLEGEVWGAIVMCVMIWGSVLWVMERLSHWISGRRYLSFTSSIFYGWGLLLEDHPFEPPPSPASQMLVGWWLLVYLILSTAYRSSLISHLVVESKSSVVNSMEELAERGVTQGWVWGVPGSPMTGVFRPFFASSSNHAILKIYELIKIIEKEEGMMRVLEGNFAYIDNYYFIKTLVSTYYTDRTGYTPVHISTTRYPLFGGNAWAFRKGAPFRARINNGIQRFLDAGLVALWMDEVIINHVRKERQALQERGDGPQLALVKPSDNQVVLGLSHLQGTFYTLILGHTLASLSFFAEIILRRR